MPGKPICKFCTRNIPKSVYKLLCSECKGWFHPQCAGVNEVDVKFLLENKKTWACKECKKITVPGRKSSFDKGHSTQGPQNSFTSLVPTELKSQDNNSQTDIAYLKSLLLELRNSNQNLKTELQEIKHSLTFLSEMYDEERSKNKIIADMMQEIKHENITLKKEVYTLKTYMNKEETNKVMKNIVITGLTNDSKENTASIKKKVNTLLKYIEPALQEESIKNIAVQNTKKNIPMVIVELDSVERKNSLLKKRKERGNILAEHCKIETTSKNIYINEHMTSLSYGLLMDAKRLSFAGYSFIWYKNGQIYARLKEGMEVVRIRDPMHIKQLLLERQEAVEEDI